VLGCEVTAIAITSALLFASTLHGAWLVPLAPVAAGGLAAMLVGSFDKLRMSGFSAWPIAVASTLVFALTSLAVDALLIPGLVALALGILGATYAVGRWTAVHPAADRPPDLVLYGSLAAGFALIYFVR
jgi:hypothetical protein